MMLAEQRPEAPTAASRGCAGKNAAPVQPEVEKTQLQLEVERAQAYAQRGQHQEAARARERAADIALEAGADDGVDPLLAATALLLHAHALLEQGEWPKSGSGLQDRVHTALQRARGAKKRNRGLEGQLLHTWSRAIFACPGGLRSDEELDQAIQARHEAVRLLVDAEVEELPWKPGRLRAAAEALAGDAACEEPLTQDELIVEVAERLGDVSGKRTSAKGIVATLRSLFDAWSEPSGAPLPDGSVACRLSVCSFLQKAADASERMDAEGDKAAAAEAVCAPPCDGGVAGLSKSEQALLALVARDGSGGWENKLREMQVAGDAETGATAQTLAADWLRIAPGVKKVTDADQEMSCGHNCSSCPSRATCQVHTALKDIEDL